MAKAGPAPTGPGSIMTAAMAGVTGMAASASSPKNSVRSYRRTVWRISTAMAAASGTASSTPTKPSTLPPATTANSAADSDRPTRTDDERQVVRMTRWLLIVALVVMGFIVLRFVAHVMGPVLAALGIAYLLDPVVERLVARGMSRALATLLILGGFLTVVALVILSLIHI